MFFISLFYLYPEQTFEDSHHETLFFYLERYENEFQTKFQIPKKYNPDPELGAWVTMVRLQTKKLSCHSSIVMIITNDVCDKYSYLMVCTVLFRILCGCLFYYRTYNCKDT